MNGYGPRSAEVQTLVEELTRGVVVLLPPVQFGQGRQRGKFFCDVVDGAGAGEGVVQALSGGGHVAEAQCCIAVKAGSSDAVAFMALDVRQFPGALHAMGVNKAFALFVFCATQIFSEQHRVTADREATPQAARVGPTK